MSDFISLPTPQLGQIHNLGGKGKRKELAEGCKCVWDPRSQHPKGFFLHEGLMLFMLIAMIKKKQVMKHLCILWCIGLYRTEGYLFFLMIISVFLLLLHSWNIWIVKWPSKRHPQTWNELRFLLMKLCVYVLKPGQLFVPITNLPIATMLNLLQATRWRMPGPIVLEYALLYDYKLLLQFY